MGLLRFYHTCVVLLTIDILGALAGSSTDAAVRSIGRHSAAVRRGDEPMAAVYGENETLFPENITQTIEFLRFVTAYRVGLEAVVDITPYSAVLAALAQSAGELSFYAFIDTWVNNGTGSQVLYMNNETGQCSAINVTDGNGWALSAEMYFWPEEPGQVDTKPKASVTVGTGFFGSNYKIGSITVHEGSIVSHHGHASLKLDEKDAFKDTRKAYVYRCPGGSAQISRAAFIGYIAYQAEQLMAVPSGNREEALQALEDEYTEYVAEAFFTRLNVNTVHKHNRTVEATYDMELAVPEVGMGVYYGGGVMTDDELEPDFWVNASYPFKPVGKVVSMQKGTLIIKMHTHCLPRGPENGMPSLIIPNYKEVLDESRSLVQTAMAVGKVKAPKQTGARPILLQPHADGFPGEEVSLTRGSGKTRLDKPKYLGTVDLDSATSNSQGFSALQLDASAGATNVGKVCVVKQEQHGHIFHRDFEVPGSFKLGDTMVMQLTVTGHGWAETTEQCGEYCHAVYRIRIDGEHVANITQFRNDCIDNPIDGSVQYGTWDESRNGWCPGTVEPGFFLDVTKFIKDDTSSHRLSFDLAVWSNNTHEYMPYVDYGGFALSDQASLVVGLTLFAYDKSAVQAIRAQSSALTPAEAAIRYGSSNPAMLHPPDEVGPIEYQALLQTKKGRRNVRGAAFQETRHSRRFPLSHSAFFARKFLGGVRARETVLAQAYDGPAFKTMLRRGLAERLSQGDLSTDPHGRLNFTAAAPWYLYNKSAQGAPGHEAGAQKVKVFSKALLQGATRTVTATVKFGDLPQKWSQVALRLKLQKPAHLNIDHWDRVASFGIKFGGSGSERMQLHPASDPTAGDRATWRLNFRHS